jgi:hypothetical protein
LEYALEPKQISATAFEKKKQGDADHEITHRNFRCIHSDRRHGFRSRRRHHPV